MTNRIVIPANFTIEVIIKLDPINGQSELMIRNRSKSQLSMWHVAGLLAEHTANVMKTILQGKVKLTAVKEEKPIIEEKQNGNGGEYAS